MQFMYASMRKVKLDPKLLACMSVGCLLTAFFVSHHNWQEALLLIILPGSAVALARLTYFYFGAIRSFVTLPSLTADAAYSRMRRDEFLAANQRTKTGTQALFAVWNETVFAYISMRNGGDFAGTGRVTWSFRRRDCKGRVTIREN
jgi:hypothetical protein